MNDESEDASLSGVPLKVELATGRLVEYQLEPGRIWGLGASPSCDLTLRSRFLSRVAVGLRCTSTRDVGVLCLQKTGYLQVETATKRVFDLTRGASPHHLSESSRLTLMAPGYICRIDLKLREEGELFIRREPGEGQSSWTVQGPREADTFWVDVAALAVAIEQYPELMRPRRNGKSITPSESLRLSAELYLGRTSRDFVNSQLHEAQRQLNINPNDTFKNAARQTVVAHAYSKAFPPAKIRRLAQSLAVDLEVLANLRV